MVGRSSLAPQAGRQMSFKFRSEAGPRRLMLPPLQGLKANLGKHVVDRMRQGPGFMHWVHRTQDFFHPSNYTLMRTSPI